MRAPSVPGRRSGARAAIVIGFAAAALAAGLVYVLGDGDGSRKPDSSADMGGLAVRSPGPGEPAPPLSLPSTVGEAYDLAGFRDKEPVLLLFQPGVRCERCWAELRAMARDVGFDALPIGSVASVATAPLGVVRRKARSERISFPVLADSSGSVSRAYNALPRATRSVRSRHTFVLVGRDGRILWRADSAGAPPPLDVLVRELDKALEDGS